MNTDFIETISFNSIKEFLSFISFEGLGYEAIIGEKNYVFRGLASERYELIPSILRNKPFFNSSFCLCTKTELQQMQIEYKLLGDFFKASDKNGLYVPNASKMKNALNKLLDVKFLSYSKWLPDDLFELAALAQHYGVPTRLLDWTQNIDVALYFAIRDNIAKVKSADRIVIWAMDVFAIQEKLQNGLAASISDSVDEGPLKIIRPPYYFNANMAAQKGLFTHWQITLPKLDERLPVHVSNDEVDRRPLNQRVADFIESNTIDLKGKKLMFKYIITLDDKQLAYSYLRRQNAVAANLFPGYAGVANNCCESFLLNIQSGKMLREI